MYHSTLGLSNKERREDPGVEQGGEGVDRGAAAPARPRLLPQRTPQSRNPLHHFTEMWCGTEAGSYLRLIVSLSLRLKDLIGPVTRVKSKEEKEWVGEQQRPLVHDYSPNVHPNPETRDPDPETRNPKTLQLHYALRFYNTLQFVIIP